MENLDVLYRRVLEAPDAEAPRLLFADAVEQMDQVDRARFIRWQIEEAHQRRKPRSQWHVPAAKATALLETHRDEWAGPIRSKVDWFDFYRGFVEEIKIDARVFLESADDLFRLAPIRKLWITGLKPVCGEFFLSPHLEQVASLIIEHQHIGDTGMKMIADSPHLRKLVFLGLVGNDVTIAGVESLAASTGLPALKGVELAGNPAEVVCEIVSYDALDPECLFAEGSVEADRIDAKYGRKTWLHTVEDHGFRIPLLSSEC